MTYDDTTEIIPRVGHGVRFAEALMGSVLPGWTAYYTVRHGLDTWVRGAVPRKMRDGTRCRPATKAATWRDCKLHPPAVVAWVRQEELATGRCANCDGDGHFYDIFQALCWCVRCGGKGKAPGPEAPPPPADAEVRAWLTPAGAGGAR